MDLDLRDDLDRCFDDGPLVDDTDLLLDRGRTALRRRRLVEATSALAVVTVVAAGAWVASGSGPHATPDRPPVASSHAATTAPSVSFTVVTDPTLTGSSSVQLLPGHQLRVGPGIELQRIVVDPYDPTTYPASVALAYRRDGKVFWNLQSVHDDGSSSGHTERARDDVDFEDWLAGLVTHPATSATSVAIDWGRPADQPIGADARAGLHIAPGVRILRLLTNPYPRVAPASSVAAVYVQDGETYWFAAIMSGSGGSASSIPAGRGGRTFDQWVSGHANSIERAATGSVRRQK
jgi:hypothetical protein